MPPIINRLVITLACLCVSFIAQSQSFYVNTGFQGVASNATYELHINPCDTITEFGSSIDTLYTCPPNQVIYDTLYNDIAIDKSDNLWFISGGGRLFRGNMNDTTSCVYLGKVQTLANSLVADTAGNIYIAGHTDDTTKIFRYDANGMHLLGHMPKTLNAAGDLFFYEHRLFMTCYYKTFDTGFIAEINLADPSQSCYYMSLGNLAAFGAFSIVDNNKSRAFVTTNPQTRWDSSELYELDMANLKVLKKHCGYAFYIRGATAYYDRTGDSTKCPYVPKSVASGEGYAKELKVLNPVVDKIRMNTNVSAADVKEIFLYDLSGRKLKNFTGDLFPGRLDISEINGGVYVLYISFRDGHTWSGKVLKI